MRIKFCLSCIFMLFHVILLLNVQASNVDIRTSPYSRRVLGLNPPAGWCLSVCIFLFSFKLDVNDYVHVKKNKTFGNLNFFLKHMLSETISRNNFVT